MNNLSSPYENNPDFSLTKAEVEVLCNGRQVMSRGKRCKKCGRTRCYRLSSETFGPIWICSSCRNVTKRFIRVRRDRTKPDIGRMSYKLISSLEEIETRSGPDEWVVGGDLHGQAMKNLIRRKLVEMQYRVTDAGRRALDAWADGVLPLLEDE